MNLAFNKNWHLISCYVNMFLYVFVYLLPFFLKGLSKENFVYIDAFIFYKFYNSTNQILLLKTQIRYQYRLFAYQ